MMKNIKLLKVTAIMLVSILIFCGLTACDKEHSSEDSETGLVEKIEFENDTAYVSYLRSEYVNYCVQGHYLYDMVVIDFAFENKMDKRRCLRDAAIIEAYQGDTQLIGQTLNSEDYPCNDFTKFNKMGVPLTCSVGFKIENDEDIRLVIYPKEGGVYESSVYQEQIIKLN